MKDYFENIIEIGDRVVFAFPKCSGTLHTGVISKVTLRSIIIHTSYRRRILYKGDSSYFLIKVPNKIEK